MGTDRRLGIRRLQAHAQGQSDPLLHDGPLQKHIMAVLGHFAGNNFVRDHVHLVQIPALIGQTGHLGKDIPADIVYRTVYTSHICFLRPSPGGRIPSR